MPYSSLWSVIIGVSLVSLFNDLFGSHCIVIFNSIYDGPCYNIICLYLPKNIGGGVILQMISPWAWKQWTW